MGYLRDILTAVRTNELHEGMQPLARLMEAKVTAALEREKRNVARTLVREDHQDFQPGDRIRTVRMGQTPGTVVKVANGNVYFEVDALEGAFGKRVWIAPLSNVVKEHIQSEEAIPQFEVQRVYDEVSDVGETELLCGIRDLRVNNRGQVISYVCEAASRYTEAQMTNAFNYASSLKNKDKKEYALRCVDHAKHSGTHEFDDVAVPGGLGVMGAQSVRMNVRDALSGRFKYGKQWMESATVNEAETPPLPANWQSGFGGSDGWVVGGGGSERPYLKNNKWVLYVYNRKTGKHALYDYASDTFLDESTKLTESVVGEDHSFHPKVKLSGGNYKSPKGRVPVGTQGRVMRGRGSKHSHVQFPNHGTVEVLNTDIRRLTEAVQFPLTEDEVPRRDVGVLKVSVHRTIAYNGKSTFYARTTVPNRDGMTAGGVETKDLPTVGAALDALLDTLTNRNRVTGKLTFAPSGDFKVTQGLQVWKQGRR